ncbi:MAG TPA: hypothetical protein C5S37_07620 [Methanophagales archaeon]|nr:hypothetical protein [Methanophagales archaeon]
MEKQKLCEKGLENYPKATVVLTNVLLLLWFGFAAYGMSALKLVDLPMLSIIYLLFAFVMLGLILRKHLCTHTLLLLQQMVWFWLGKIEFVFIQREIR